MFSLTFGTLFALGIVPSHIFARHHRGQITTLVLIDVLALYLVCLGTWWPDLFSAAMQEDRWAEWATVCAFFGASLVFAVRAWRRRSDWLFSVGSAALALFCLFVAGEEISWGQRLFAFQPPEVFLAKNFQQELNVHNFLKNKDISGFKLDSKYLVVLIASAYGLVGPVFGKLANRWRIGRTVGELTPKPYLCVWFCAVAFAELWYPISLTGEACELVLGVLFLAAALDSGESQCTALRRALALVAPIVISFALVPSIDLLLYGDDEVAVAQTERELEALGKDLSLAFGRRFYKKSSIHKRVYTSSNSGYFDASKTRRFSAAVESPGRQTYFLDPWNNPYWMHAKKNQPTIVYSFGPNRRRDSNLGAAEVLGDDIAVELVRGRAK